jgi:phage gp46-like protein
MADIKTFFLGFDQGADYAVDSLGLVEDEGLQTAVILSLFTDRRAEADDVIPDGTTDRRGWWADAYPAVDGDRIGSRLWLLSREKQLNSVVNKAREYAQEALAWMIEDGIAASVDIQASIVRTGVLGLTVAISQPNGAAANYRYEYLWRSM